MRRRRVDYSLQQCDRCGRHFLPGNQPDGTPNGLKAIMQDGSELTLCNACICWGGAHPEEWAEYLEDN